VNKQRITLVVHLLFFAIWGVWLLNAHRGGQTIWLETIPVDPRDYISGHYVALVYKVNNPEVSSCADLIKQWKESNAGGTIYVRLKKSSKTLVSVEGTVNLWTAVSCQTTKPKQSPKKMWIRTTFDSSSWRVRLRFGIEKFFVPETSPLRYARSGQVVAKVSVNDSFDARILDLVKLKL